MAFQTVNDTAEIVITYNGNGRDARNVLHATLLGGYGLADLTSLANNVDTEIPLSWLPLQSSDFTYLFTTVRGLEFENDEEVTVSTNSGPGTVLTPSMPGNVTLSVKKGSGLTGRSARGRLYWIGAPAAALSANENLFTVADSDAIRDAVEAMRARINTTAWTASLVSRFTGGVERPFGVIFDWTETSLVNNNVDSQRRRLVT